MKTLILSLSVFFFSTASMAKTTVTCKCYYKKYLSDLEWTEADFRCVGWASCIILEHGQALANAAECCKREARDRYGFVHTKCVEEGAE